MPAQSPWERPFSSSSRLPGDGEEEEDGSLATLGGVGGGTPKRLAVGRAWLAGQTGDARGTGHSQDTLTQLGMDQTLLPPPR